MFNKIAAIFVSLVVFPAMSSQEDLNACYNNQEYFKQSVNLSNESFEQLIEDAQVPVPKNIQDIFENLIKANDLVPTFENPEWKLVGLESDDDMVFSTAGGTVTLAERFWKREGFSEDEVAAILAHEISHVLLRHILKKGCIGIQLSGKTLDFANAILMMREESLSQNAWGETFRKFEYEADAMAMVLLKKLGKDPRLLISVYEKFEIALPEGPRLAYQPMFRERKKRITDALSPEKF